MGLSYSALHTYLPYSKVIYKMSEISQNAERVKTYKARKSVVDTLMAAPTKGHLWDCIVAFQNYPFYTVSGLPFSYTLKKGRNGEYTKELFIDRRENSKSLAWSSVRMAFERALEQQSAVFTRPKELADVRGVSYTFSLLWRFGMISVSEEVEKKLKGNRKVSKVVYPEESYNLKKAYLCGYVPDSVIRCFMHTILGGTAVGVYIFLGFTILWFLFMTYLSHQDGGTHWKDQPGTGGESCRLWISLIPTLIS